MSKQPKRSKKISRKFILGIAMILLFTLIVSLFVNSKIVERYYLHRQTKYVSQVGVQLQQYISQGIDFGDAVASLEDKEKVLIVYSEEMSNLDQLSMTLRDKFRQKGLGFQKFWLWNEDYIYAVEKGHQFRFYQQYKMNYGILVEYIPINSYLFAVAAIVPNAEDFVEIINQFGILLYSFSLFIAIILIYLLVKHITNPLKKIEEFSQKISIQEYGTLTINTKDEFEMVADSMNQMSLNIQQYQKKLLGKNHQMEQLLDNVAHDLKTPISLVGMYAAGIKDGLDDGTFLDTIIQQNTRMAQLVEHLLSLSRIGQKECPFTRIALDKLLIQNIEEQKILLQEGNLKISTSIVSDAVITGNTEMISALFSNLLSNAVKYSSGDTIEISLKKEEKYHFIISNEIQNNDLDIERIWEPFYVGESSRNKLLSGTGLGLAIVKKIAQQYGYSITCTKEKQKIQFDIIF